MVTQAEGFLTSDNKFFETKQQAEFHEARMELLEAIGRTGIKQDNMARALRMIEVCREEIMRYVNAVIAMPTREQDDAQAASEGVHGEGEDDDNLGYEDDGYTEEEVEAVQQLPPGVREPMPDVGRHIQPAKIRVERPVNGPRGGRGNAPGVRRR